MRSVTQTSTKGSNRPFINEDVTIKKTKGALGNITKAQDMKIIDV
ncbi:hypothetical protein MCHI_002704 [Candidatus Magnetoovum chiemensis]|nr:hypothetical protein MCHI_002704 [Candidatus Magnetoovum chiemensis]